MLLILIKRQVDKKTPDNISMLYLNRIYEISVQVRLFQYGAEHLSRRTVVKKDIDIAKYSCEVEETLGLSNIFVSPNIVQSDVAIKFTK